MERKENIIMYSGGLDSLLTLMDIYSTNPDGDFWLYNILSKNIAYSLAERRMIDYFFNNRDWNKLQEICEKFTRQLDFNGDEYKDKIYSFLYNLLENFNGKVYYDNLNTLFESNNDTFNRNYIFLTMASNKAENVWFSVFKNDRGYDNQYDSLEDVAYIISENSPHSIGVEFSYYKKDKCEAIDKTYENFLNEIEESDNNINRIVFSNILEFLSYSCYDLKSPQKNTQCDNCPACFRRNAFLYYASGYADECLKNFKDDDLLDEYLEKCEENTYPEKVSECFTKYITDVKYTFKDDCVIELTGR